MFVDKNHDFQFQNHWQGNPARGRNNARGSSRARGGTSRREGPHARAPAMQRVPTTRGRRGRARATAPSRDTRHRRRVKRSDDGPAALTNVEKRRKRRKYDKKPQQRAAIIRKAHQQRAMLNDHVQNQMQEKSITEREVFKLRRDKEARKARKMTTLMH